MTRLLLTLLLVSIAIPATAAEHEIPFEEARARAEAEGKILVVDFFTDWCVWCKVFDKALADPSTGMADALDQVVFTSIDAEKGEGIELAERYDVSVFPTYTALTAEGEMIHSWAGFEGPEWFIGELQGSIDDPTPFAKKIEQYEANPTAEVAERLAEVMAISGQPDRAMQYILAAEKLDPDTDRSSQLLDTAFMRARKDDSFSMEDYVDLARKRVLDRDADAATVLEATYYVGRVTRGEKDHATVRPFLEKSRDALASDAEVPAGLANAVELDVMLILDGDKQAALEKKRSMMPEGWTEDASRLNSFAWWCFENDVNLEEAQQLALKGAELAQSPAERAQVLDTAAELCNALGNCDEAIVLIKRAIEDDPDNEYYPEQLARFEAIAAGE